LLAMDEAEENAQEKYSILGRVRDARVRNGPIERSRNCRQ